MFSAILTGRDYATLVWLSERGYDAGALDAATDAAYHEDEYVTLSWDNNAACQVSEAFNEDPDAFLACCGSETLAETLRALIERAV